MNKLEEFLNENQDEDKLSFEGMILVENIKRVNKFIIDTNLESQTNIKGNVLSFKVPARKLIRKYLDILLKLKGQSLKNKISDLQDSEVVDFILCQCKRNSYNKEPDSAWQLKNMIKKFKSANIVAYDCNKMIAYLYESKSLYGLDIIEGIRLESCSL